MSDSLRNLDLFANNFNYEFMSDKRTDEQIMADAKAALERRRQRKLAALAAKEGNDTAAPTKAEGSMEGSSSKTSGNGSGLERTLDSNQSKGVKGQSRRSGTADDQTLSLDRLRISGDSTGKPTSDDSLSPKGHQHRGIEQPSAPTAPTAPTATTAPAHDKASGTPANSPPASPGLESQGESQGRNEKRSILDKFRRKPARKGSSDQT
ncbi:hypothetical protein CC2G_004400 [Coprinopsis cinerea AmutBmut pab1-1]|nr:hypothetical protein CC2G_004400 [Coprinopsis cinerea AmutBmut pab1-1]